VSVAAVPKYLTAIVAAVVESEACPVTPAVPFTTVTTGVPSTVAYEGTELSKLRPNAATATNATLLKFVFVDMYFLSLVVTRNFLVAASR